MKSDQLFRQTRWRLAGWYAGVMGVSLVVGSLFFYYCTWLIQKQSYDQTVEDLAGTLHDYLQPKLQQPGQLQPDILAVLDGSNVRETNLLGITRQPDYYIRLVDLQGNVLAASEFQPDIFPQPKIQQRWQTLKAKSGTRYRQISDYLHNSNGETWGYLQLGRSLAEFDRHLQGMRLLLFLSIPGAMLVVGGSGWWLAGLAMQPIYRSYRQMQQFTADAAHELRTPLATTRTLVQTALQRLQAGRQIDAKPLQAIERQNERLNQLIADLLLLSRADTATVATFTPCCVHDLINDLYEELAPLALSSGVELSFNGINTLPIHILGNEEQLSRLLMNLITNGIQYTPAGGEVRVRLEAMPTFVKIHVADSGIGIPPEAQRYIFDRFYRVDAARSRHTGGVGLGLSICLAIAQAHNGTIQVQSQVGRGSLFTVTLPRLMATKSE